MGAAAFQGKSVSKLGAKDIRFTRNKANSVIYAIVWVGPRGDVVQLPRARPRPTNPERSSTWNSGSGARR